MILEPTIFYVYIYLDPRMPGKYQYKDLLFDNEPFYVGKGKGTRFLNGLKDKTTCLKINKIRSISKSGLKPIVIKIYQDLKEQESLDLEIQTISKIGRLQLNKGPLTNMTGGGDGWSNRTHSTEWKTKLSKIVISIDLVGNEKEYPSIKEAAKQLEISAQGIGFVCNHPELKRNAGGFSWKYKDPSDVKQKHMKQETILSLPKHSEETKQKLRKAKVYKHGFHPCKGRPRNAKKVYQYDLNSNLIKIWRCSLDCFKELGFHSGQIGSACKGARNHLSYGFLWKYA